MNITTENKKLLIKNRFRNMGYEVNDRDKMNNIMGNNILDLEFPQEALQNILETLEFHVPDTLIVGEDYSFEIFNRDNTIRMDKPIGNAEPAIKLSVDKIINNNSELSEEIGNEYEIKEVKLFFKMDIDAFYEMFIIKEYTLEQILQHSIN